MGLPFEAAILARMNFHSAPTIGTPRLIAHVVRPRELDGDLLAQWEAMRDTRACYASAFYAPQFTMAVGQVRRDARVAIFERAGQVVGFLPYHLLARGVAKPIGGHLNDYHGAIVAPGIDPGDSELLQAALLAAYDFNHLPAELGRNANIARPNLSSPKMEIAEGHEVYLRGRDASFRRGYSAMQRKLRKLGREVGEIAFTFHSTDPAHVGAHAHMRTALYRKAGIKDAFASGWQGDVIACLRAMRDPDFRTVLNVLRAGEEVVAAHFGLVSRGTMHWWFPAYADSRGQYSPGIAMIDLVAREAAPEAIKAIDFGRGDERYKSFFANAETPLLAGSLARPNSLAASLRVLGHRSIDPLQSILPASLQHYPQRIAERMLTGAGIPRFG